MGAWQEFANDHIVIVGALVRFPTGDGGGSATASASVFATDRSGKLESVILTNLLTTGVVEVRIRDHDGNELGNLTASGGGGARILNPRLSLSNGIQFETFHLGTASAVMSAFFSKRSTS